MYTIQNKLSFQVLKALVEEQNVSAILNDLAVACYDVGENAWAEWIKDESEKAKENDASKK